MALTNPREWMFQGWIALRLPWFPDHAETTRIGNGLLTQFPSMTDAVYDEGRRTVFFRERWEGPSRMDLSIAPGSVSFISLELERADHWRTFNMAVIRLLSDTGLFEAKFNLLQARQSIVVTIREVPDPGKRLFDVLGNNALLQTIMRDIACAQMGTDLEFVFPVAAGVPEKLILRFQTCGPSAAWIPANQVWLTASAMLDPKPEKMQNIVKDWEKAQDVLLDWLSNTLHPSLIAPLIERLG